MPSRISTPLPETQSRAVEQAAEEKQEEDGTKREDADGDGSPQETNGSPAPAAPTPELPTEIRVRLKKLDRLEPKYGELLKAYRIAHAKLQVIEPFEATLREHTPLTNIADPGAFVEYLNQVTTKSEMVLDEFRRVSGERDELRKKADQSEDAAGQLRAEVAELKKATAETPQDVVAGKPMANTDATPPTHAESSVSMNEASSPTLSVKSPASTSSRIPSFSLFSPRSKPTSPPPKETAEDFFSYDSEVPRLEAELQQRQTEVDEIKSHMQKLKGDLVVARESTEGMVHSLESATRELHELRDAKDKFDDVKASLEKRIEELDGQAKRGADGSEKSLAQIEKLRGENDRLSQELEGIKIDIEVLDRSKKDADDKLLTTQSNANIINGKLSQKDAIVKDLEDSLAMAKSAERQAEKEKRSGESSEKRLSAMQGIMDSLRAQLDSAEHTVKELRNEIKTNQEDFDSRPSSKVFGFLDETSRPHIEKLETKDNIVEYLASNFGLRKGSQDQTSNSTVMPAPSEAATTQSPKKSKKKKKKGKGGQAAAQDQEPDSPVKASENLAELGEGDAKPQQHSNEAISELEDEIRQLKAEIGEKGSAIDRLSKQIKDQEALQEEIETLRDDLLHQGEEHVEARDALKTAEAERKKLSGQVEELETELSAAQKKVSEGSVSDDAHQKTLKELEEVRSKSSSLQKDSEVAEQLAAARFKDITDLKDVLSKAQPELRSLRSEVAELKTVKDDLKNKTGELSRLESRHEDLKAEMKGLSKRLGDKDSEIKELQQKIEQETSTRIRAEEDQRTAQSELRSTEGRRQDAVNTSNEYSQDLKKAKDEAVRFRAQLSGLEDQVSAHDRQVHELREEVGLKTALHSSSQNLVQSLRDQTHELTTQAREAGTRAENLEEELAEAQRMLSERTREGQTMRMLLNQSETGTESRVREMKERMDAAIEERDRIEDEASVGNRRMMRELEDAKGKARDVQRALKILEEEKDELELKQRDWKRRRDDLEKASERASKDVEDVRTTMTGLREALNESERQVREMEAHKTDLRKVGEEAKERVGKLTKANKNLTEELKVIQGTSRKGPARPGLESGIQSSRTSIDSSSARSPAPTSREKERLSTTTSTGDTPAGLSQGTVDYVYLKNVLLQFLEQKDKTHQRQLIPVIGMLLHFDR